MCTIHRFFHPFTYPPTHPFTLFTIYFSLIYPCIHPFTHSRLCALPTIQPFIQSDIHLSINASYPSCYPYPPQLTPSHLVFWSCHQRSCSCLLMEWRNRTNMGADLKSRCGQQASPCQHVRSRPACSQIKGSSSVEARNDNCRHILYRPPRHRLPGARKCVNRALTIASPPPFCHPHPSPPTCLQLKSVVCFPSPAARTNGSE